MSTLAGHQRSRGGKPWQARLLGLLRTALTIFVLVQAVEWWQARGLWKGSFPKDYDELPYLDETLSAAHPGGETRLEHRLLYVWAPWCGVCRMSAANLNSFPSTGFVVESLALSWSDTKELSTFVQETGMVIPVRLGGDAMERALRISAYPSYFLIAPDGRVLKAWSGYTTTLGLLLKAWVFRLLDKG